MIRITETSTEVEPERTAQPNKSDVSTSTPESVRESGEEEREEPQAEADKCGAKIHYYSRSVALEHGVNAAAVLAGFAFKLQYHRKNWWKNRWWYYETLETLCERRWPYFTPSGLFGIVDYLADPAHPLLIKDCNNKLTFDETTWYAMEDSVRTAALSDSLWFDVRVAKMEGLGIAGATIYHNLRFHLRRALKADPSIGLPYHELNKRQLARDLPFSYSTVKRVVAELLKAGLIQRHPKKKKWFTLTDVTELGLIGPTANENGSFANRNGSTSNGSTSNKNGSSAYSSGSSANRNGSFSNDNTQYETDKKTSAKPLRNDCSLAEKSNVAANAADECGQEHKHTGCNTGSFVPRTLHELQQCISSNKPRINTFRQPGARGYSVNVTDTCEGFLSECLDSEALEDALRERDADSLVKQLAEPIFSYTSRIFRQSMSAEDIRLYQNSALHALVGAILFRQKSSQEIADQFAENFEEMQSVAARITSMREENETYSATEKAEIFVEGVHRRNKTGWPDSEGETISHQVWVHDRNRKQAEEVIARQPANTPANFLHLLSQCVEAHVMKDVPEGGHDPFWHARRGVELDFFFKNWQTIAEKLEIAASLRRV